MEVEGEKNMTVQKWTSKCSSGKFAGSRDGWLEKNAKFETMGMVVSKCNLHKGREVNVKLV